jgi:hypothetical protein
LARDPSAVATAALPFEHCARIASQSKRPRWQLTEARSRPVCGVFAVVEAEKPAATVLARGIETHKEPICSVMMHWFLLFGQVAAALIGLYFLTAGFVLLVFKLLSREDYSFEGDKLDHRH